jgi:hypothetical protein
MDEEMDEEMYIPRLPSILQEIIYLSILDLKKFHAMMVRFIIVNMNRL